MQGSNNIALSVSIASQDQNRIYFTVNGFAIIDQASQSANVYQLSQALPGVIDTQSNEVQIDMGNLQSVMGSPQQASVNDLYQLLRPSINSIMVNVVATPTQTSGGQIVFRLQDLSMILPDGTQDTFNMQQQISAVYDQSSMKLFTVAFPQLYDVINTFVTNVQNNYYTTIIYDIVPAAPIVVSPPVLYPPLTVISYPSVWPIFYPVPVPVPFPTTRPSITPRPTRRPTVSPTMKPTVSPTRRPTISPTIRPTVSPTRIATISPTARPTITRIPTISPTIRATISPTARPTIRTTPTSTIRPSLRPAISATPRATLIASPRATARPTIRATTPVGRVPTIQRPVATARAPARVTAAQPIRQTTQPIRQTPTRTPRVTA